MPQEKKLPPTEKTKIHPRNKHRERYNFKELVESCPGLAPFVKPNKYNVESIDFFNPEAVKMLNTAILKRIYEIDLWDIPPHYLSPPIPGRADYIHYVADLLSGSNHKKIPTGKKIRCLDIGTGANCIYPIIGNKEYGWSYVGTEIDPIAIEAANKTIASNPSLKGHIQLRLQPNPKDTFHGIVHKDELFDVTMCNPPFHASAEEAQNATIRKLKNLKREKVAVPTLNFGGKNRELWCEGGEIRFVQNMIRQSKGYANSCFWFTTLISKESNLKRVYSLLKNMKSTKVITMQMDQGNKTSRIIAWTFLNPEQQKEWMDTRWK
jgi:23S rRNA (adenine1618-N6)-methyltransferase